ANIKNNTISAEGSNIGSEGTGDPLLSKNSMGITLKGYALIENNTISASDIGIQVVKGSDEVSIAGNKINVNVNTDAIDNYAIVAVDTDDLVIENNSIAFVGKNNGTTQSNAILADGIDSLVIKNNTFDLSLVSAHVDWPEIPEGSWNYVRTPYSEGIVIKDSEGAIFDGNTVTVVYNNFTGSDDTIYVIDLVDSANSMISNNHIEASGHTYVYGMIIVSTNFTAENNTVYAIADGYCAYAINPDAGASGVVKNNTLVAIAPDVAYTVYSMMWGDPTGMDIKYVGNQLYGKAYYVNVFDIGGANEDIINNTVIAEGNYTIAIYSGSKNNTISGNIIRALGSGEGNKTIGYTVNEIEAIKLSGANAVISDNYIESTGQYAIDLGNTDSTVENDNIKAKNSVGTAAIANAGSGAVIANITPSLKTVLSAVDVNMFYDDGEVYYVTAMDENGNPITNVTIVLSYANGTVIDSQLTDQKGIAPFYIDYAAGEYAVVATFYGNDVYGSKSFNGYITVDPRPTEIYNAANPTVLLTAVKSGYYYKITLVDTINVGVAGKSVAITFDGKTKNYTTDENGVIKYKLVASKTGNKKITISFKDSNYVEASSSTTIKLTKQATKITAAKKTFKASVKTKKYTITLKDSKGKVIKSAKVTITVKGKKYSATVKNGKATFKITKLTKVGSWTAKVKFAGNTYYKASTKSVKIVVKK
ncbi:hypothetical protein, partial [Methanobrevibacter sp.]|uniref:hypothetical protein n=1 Tax=Methanobrevibacter sp. TaxID=66852 RepID=UPI0026DFC19C